MGKVKDGYRRGEHCSITEGPTISYVRSIEPNCDDICSKIIITSSDLAERIVISPTLILGMAECVKQEFQGTLTAWAKDSFRGVSILPLPEDKNA